MHPRRPHLDDLAAIAAVALLFLASCAGCAVHAAMFVRPKVAPPPRPADVAAADAMIVAPTTDPETGRFNFIHPTPPLPLTAFQAAAIRLELMSAYESAHYFTDMDHYFTDMETMRQRWADLRDAPPLIDAERLPDIALINKLLSFNRAYRRRLADSRGLDRASWLDLHETLRETDRLYEAWDTARDARCEDYHLTVRRGAMRKLRDLIGPQAYYSGCLPPHVPVWRFRRID